MNTQGNHPVSAITNELLEHHAVQHAIRQPGWDPDTVLFTEEITVVIQGRIKGLRPQTLGLIGAQGAGHNAPKRARVSCFEGGGSDTYLDKYDSGEQILIKLAAAVIRAQMITRLRKHKIAQNLAR